jgi:chromosome segregation ATPase
MSSPAIQIEQDAAHADDLQAASFQALEQRVLRAIDLLRKERELRAAAEQRVQSAEEHTLELEIQLEEKTLQLDQRDTHLTQHFENIQRLESDLSQLQKERDAVRQRVERLLQHLDEFTGA